MQCWQKKLVPKKYLIYCFYAKKNIQSDGAIFLSMHQEPLCSFLTGRLMPNKHQSPYFLQTTMYRPTGRPVPEPGRIAGTSAGGRQPSEGKILFAQARALKTPPDGNLCIYR